MSRISGQDNQTAPRIKYVPAVGPRLKKLLLVVFGLFAVLAVNSAYLAAVTSLEWLTGRTYQNYFYQYMFLAHLVLGLLIVLPVVMFGAVHIKNARHHGSDHRRRQAAVPQV